MTNDGDFTGDLSHDSPQLAGHLRRFFSEMDRQALADIYKDVWKCGGCLDEVLREPGVSFNPKPARLCCLLIQEGDVRDAELLSITLLSCVPRNSPKLIPDSASAIRCRQTPIDTRLEPLYVVHDIDILRHAHMELSSPSYSDQVIAEISKRAPLYLHSSKRIRDIFEHALRRCIKG